METDWYCPKCKWWINEDGLSDPEYDNKVVVALDWIHCPKCETALETRPAEFAKYRRRACDKPRKSVAMGVRVEDIPKAMKKWPGSRYDKDGYLEVSGRAEKKQRMKQRGFCEY